MSHLKKTIISLSMISLILSGCQNTKEQNTKDNKQEIKKEESNKASFYDITLKNEEGKDIKLSDYKGKKIYINFWTSWCKYCEKETYELLKVYDTFKDDKDVIFLSITSPNDAEFKNNSPLDKEKKVILDTAKNQKINYPIFFDTNDKITTTFKIDSIPAHIFINSDGSIQNNEKGYLKEEDLIKKIKDLK